MPKNKDKILRKMTFQIYKNQKHESTQQSGIYKYNQVTGKEVADPFKKCKSLDDVKRVLIEDRPDYLKSIFSEEEKPDFVLVKIDKRGLSVFQQIFPNELVNSVRFIKED